MLGWSRLKLANSIGYAGLIILAGLLFYPLGARLLRGKWPDTISFSREINLRAQGINPTRLPYSHHNSRANDFFLFDEDSERYASERAIIEANQMFWKVRRPLFSDDHEQRIFLLQPFSVVGFIITRLGMFVLLSLVWIGFLGWCIMNTCKPPRRAPKLIN